MPKQTHNGRTRERSYTDYGFLPGDEREIKTYIRSHSDEETTKLLIDSAYESNEAIARELAISLIKGISYEKLCIIEEIPYSPVDFYGYRRKCMAIFKRKIEQEPS